MVPELECGELISPEDLEFTEVCRKCAVRFGTVRAKVRLFNTASKVLPCGLGWGKSLIRVVSAVGIEPTTY